MNCNFMLVKVGRAAQSFLEHFLSEAASGMFKLAGSTRQLETQRPITILHNCELFKTLS